MLGSAFRLKYLLDDFLQTSREVSLPSSREPPVTADDVRVRDSPYTICVCNTVGWI